MSTKPKAPLLALYENVDGALALTVCGCVAWMCPAPSAPGKAHSGPVAGQTPPGLSRPTHLRLVAPVAPQPKPAKKPSTIPNGPWSLLSDDEDQVHTVLLNTGIFDRLVEHVGAAIEKRSGPMLVWFPGGGSIPLDWLIKNSRRED